MRTTIVLSISLMAPLVPAMSEPAASPPIAHSYVISASTQQPHTPPYGPADLATAYQLPTRSIDAPATGYGPETVAIVDGSGDRAVQADLAVYDARYGLPACTDTNGCLLVRNENGEPSPLPPDQSRRDEIGLDVETVHGLCQSCRILLLLTNADVLSLSEAERTAVRLGATVISNSWGTDERAVRDWKSVQQVFEQETVPMVASSGDSGYGTSFPASAGPVIAAGGTTLTLNDDGSVAAETAWRYGGSGCSRLSAAAWFQTRLMHWSQVGCGASRAEADLAADADPQTGVAIYTGSWLQVGGTSLSAPIIASAIALARGSHGHGLRPQIYARHSLFYDVTSGANGTCGRAICRARPGYDGPTGVGAIRGIGAFLHTLTIPGPLERREPPRDGAAA